jgi:hypothetical protein
VDGTFRTLHHHYSESCRVYQLAENVAEPRNAANRSRLISLRCQRRGCCLVPGPVNVSAVQVSLSRTCRKFDRSILVDIEVDQIFFSHRSSLSPTTSKTSAESYPIPVSLILTRRKASKGSYRGQFWRPVRLFVNATTKLRG